LEKVLFKGFCIGTYNTCLREQDASPFVVVENVKETLDYYQSIFGDEIKILNKHEGKVMHAELHFENIV
jgi:hypothetical protein